MLLDETNTEECQPRYVWNYTTAMYSLMSMSSMSARKRVTTWTLQAKADTISDKHIHTSTQAAWVW